MFFHIADFFAVYLSPVIKVIIIACADQSNTRVISNKGVISSNCNLIVVYS